VVLYVLITLGQLFFYPAIMAIVMGQAAQNEGKNGAYMGFYRTMQAIAGIAAPAIGTFIYVRAGPMTLWISCAALAASFAVILASWRAFGLRRALRNYNQAVDGRASNSALSACTAGRIGQSRTHCVCDRSGLNESRLFALGPH
jgi:MFS family permease